MSDPTRLRSPGIALNPVEFECTRQATKVELREVEFYTDQYRYEEPGGGEVDDFEWCYTPDFDIRDFDPGFPWADWFLEERQYRLDEGYTGLEFVFQVPPEKWYPIFVVEGRDGKWYIWDGNHRVGAAYVLEVYEIPALVGVRRDRW